MKRETMLKGKTIYYDYDEYQDALFVTFDKDPPLSYYEEREDGILVRWGAESNRVVGYTIRNVSMKVFEQYASVFSNL